MQVTVGGACSGLPNQCSVASSLVCITSNNGGNCPNVAGNRNTYILLPN